MQLCRETMWYPKYSIAFNNLMFNHKFKKEIKNT